VRAMRYAALLDTETTALDPALGQVIEVAVTVFDLVIGSPVASFASLIQGERNEAFAVNRISEQLLVSAPSADVVWRRVAAVIEGCDIFIAHRAEFDKSWTPEPLRSSRPWVCSKFWIEWPLSEGGAGLVHVALAHGCGVVQAHRAMTDVDTLSRVLSRCKERGHDLVAMMDRAMRPRCKVQALVSYDDREKAKSLNFQWEPDTKRWTREMFEDQVASLPFPTRRL